DALTPGLYRFDGADLLTVCHTLDEKGGKRPTDFNAEKDSLQFLLVLQRVKPGEEKLTAQDIEKIREVPAFVQHRDNLKKIGYAFHDFHNVNKHLPAHAIYSNDGKTPLLSWRVAILPYIGEAALYREFKLDEPWDSAHNRKLIAKMPKLYE